MSSTFVPEPDISLAIKAKGQSLRGRDDHFWHLEIYVETGIQCRLSVLSVTGKPRVNFRETVTGRADFNYTHKKQTGSAVRYAKVVGHIEPMEFHPGPVTEKDVAFENVVMGGSIPSRFIPAVERVHQLVGLY